MKRENKKYRADKRGWKKKPQRAKAAAEKYIEGELQGSERGYALDAARSDPTTLVFTQSHPAAA